MSDALCRLATGAGWATRRFYTDADEEVFSQSIPVRITGIEDFISNGDLLDRTMLVGLPYHVLMVSFFDRQAPEEAASRVYAVHN